MPLLRGTNRTVTPRPEDNAEVDVKVKWIHNTLKSFYVANGGRARGPFNPADEIFDGKKSPTELIALLEKRAKEKLESRSGLSSLFFRSGELSAEEKTVADMKCCQYYDARDKQHYHFDIRAYAKKVQQEAQQEGQQGGQQGGQQKEKNDQEMQEMKVK